MMAGQFGVDGKPVFIAVPSKTRDMSQLQAGMFMDRPDLWRKPPPKRRHRVPTEQQRLFE